MLNTISAYWHMIGVARDRRHPLDRSGRSPLPSASFSRETLNLTGWGGEAAPNSFGSIVFWYVFLTGLLMAQYTITGFDASAHVAEETHQASRSAAVGMYMSVVASVVFGFILLVAVTRALPASPCSTSTSCRRAGSTAMGQSWGTFILFICCVAPVLLPHRVGDVGVADAVRVLPRPRRPGSSALAPRLA